MSDAEELAGVVGDLLAERLGPDTVRDLGRTWAADLWGELESLGMTTVDVPERLGGGGGTTAEALTVVRVAGYHNAPIPLAESAFVGGWLKSQAGLPVSEGPSGIAVCRNRSVYLDDSDGRSRLTGTVAVPWGRHARELLVVLEDGDATQLAVVDPAAAGTALTWTHGSNVAGEPRDEVRLTGAVCREIHDLPDVSVESALARAALGRAALMVGALERVVDLSLGHVTVREQFGRPLARFQVIAHYLATMTTQLVAARAALEGAARTAEGSAPHEVDSMAVAAAKTRAGASAEVITLLGHQVHGAIGTTEEHELGLSSRRLWAWRDEDGDEQYWSGVLGRQIASRAYGSGLWPVLAPV